GVRDSSASAHDAMEVVVMLRVEETEQGHDRVPRVGAPRLDEEAADLAIGSVAQTAIRRHLYSVQRRIRRYRRAIEDADVLCQRGDNQIDVEADEFLYRDRRAEFHQHFEPQAEAPGVQLFVEAGPVAAPQVAIEDHRQLRGRRQRHELAAILESAALNDPMQDFGLQPRDDLREVRRVQNALEQSPRVSSVWWSEAFAPAVRVTRARVAKRVRTAMGTMAGFPHRPAMIQAPVRNKQS